LDLRVPLDNRMATICAAPQSAVKFKAWLFRVELCLSAGDNVMLVVASSHYVTCVVLEAGKVSNFICSVQIYASGRQTVSRSSRSSCQQVSGKRCAKAARVHLAMTVRMLLATSDYEKLLYSFCK